MNFVRRLTGTEKPLIRVLRLAGSIRNGRRKSINLLNLEKQIEQAFDCKKTKPKAVVLEINSTGGSAVQSNLIYSRVRNLANKTELPVISFVEDTAVSGGYWLALAGDEIYAEKSSAVGHIGALSVLFGFEEAIKKLGIEWRAIQAGEHKIRMDPFKPVKPQDAEWMHSYLKQVHQHFIELVKERRKNLDVDHKTVFEADIFTGQHAAEIGLIDGTCSDLNALMKQKFGEDILIKRIEAKSKFPFGFGGFETELKMNTEEIIETMSDVSMKNRFTTY